MKQRPLKRYVYFIRVCNTKHYKIGIADNLEKRFAAFRTHNHEPLIVEYSYHLPADEAARLEKHLHQEFRKNRTHGEWFYLDHYEVFDALEIARKAVKENFYQKREPEYFP